MRTHKPGSRPGAKAHEIGPALDGVQAVVADLQAQKCQVRADGLQPCGTGGAVRCNHDAVVHVAGVAGHLQGALAKVVKAVEVNIRERLAHQVANGHACWLIAVGKLSQEGDGWLALDGLAQQHLQYIAVDAVKKLTHIHMQHPARARGSADD